jgi:hypothetical protein
LKVALSSIKQTNKHTYLSSSTICYLYIVYQRQLMFGTYSLLFISYGSTIYFTNITFLNVSDKNKQSISCSKYMQQVLNNSSIQFMKRLKNMERVIDQICYPEKNIVNQGEPLSRLQRCFFFSILMFHFIFSLFIFTDVQ